MRYSGTTLLAATAHGIWSYNGTNFSQVSTTGLLDQYCQSLGISGSNVFCGTYAVFYKSTDAGVSWNETDNGMAKVTSYSVAISNNNIYVIPPPGTNTPYALVARSTDGGTTWNTVTTNRDPLGSGNVLEANDIA